MTRIGINPARGKISTYQPAKVSVCLITYIPEESGYFEHRLQVIKLVFASLQAHTTLPYDLLVFDNASCPAAVNYLQSLQDEGIIDYLLLSRQNIGKIGALRILFHAAPGEVIAYSDDDIFFYPGWLEAHLQILEAFPKAGMVSGLPVRNAARHARKSLDALIERPMDGIHISWERRIPQEWEEDWAASTGRDPQAHLAATIHEQDLVLRRGATAEEPLCEAIGSANHFQFVAMRQVLLQALPGEWSGKLMGAMIELDEAIDEMGYLRLSTTQRFTRHLGNHLSPEALQTALTYNLVEGNDRTAMKQPANSNRQQTTNRHWLVRIPGGRRALAWLYHRLFKILYR